MLDCGIHPGFAGLRSLPYLDTEDLATVDLMLITHFHLDHCAAVPYVTGHTNFKVHNSMQASQYTWKITSWRRAVKTVSLGRLSPPLPAFPKISMLLPILTSVK